MSTAPPPVGWQAGPGVGSSSRPSWVTREPEEPGSVSPPAAPPPPERKKRGVLVPLLAGFLGAVLGSGVSLVSNRDTAPSPAPAVTSGPAPAPAAGAPAGGVAGIAGAVLPSVVRIDATGVTLRGRTGTSTGSGVIFRPDGYIITNDHVVSDSTSLQVTLPSGDKLPARLIGTAAPSDDIAVIKVDRKDLKPAALGTVANLSVGDLAVAVGSPFGLEGSVTAGVISALHRNFEVGEGQRFTDAVQTDASINPGNSGGALANGRGEVIGINSVAAVSPSGGGVGFAIPIDIARRDAEQIIATGKASRPYLGITGENVTGRGGALIGEVSPAGPAAQAGLQPGDTIIQIEKSKIGSMEELISALSRLEVDRTVTVKYRRGGSERTAEVTLRARP